MDHGLPQYTHKEIFKMFPVTQAIHVGGGGRKRTEVLSGMIAWNILVLILLVLAVCVQGRGAGIPQDTSLHSALRRSPQSDPAAKDSDSVPDLANSAASPTLSPQSSAGSDSDKPQDSKATPESNKESGDKGEGRAPETGEEGGGDKQPVPENKDSTSNTNSTTKEDSENGSLPSHLPSMSTEAVLRGFYVFVGIGAIILIYIVIKLARLRKRRAPGKYRVLSHADDQEMFPLAAGEGEDEEIFNAAHHQPRQ